MSRPRGLTATQAALMLDRDKKNINSVNVLNTADNYIIDSLVPRDGLTVLGGAAKTGKTTLCMQLMHDIITQNTFLDRRIIHNEENPLKTLYITNEDSETICFSRLLAIFGEDEGVENVEIMVSKELRYADGTLLSFVEAAAEEGYNLFIIDNFRSFGVDAGIEKDVSGARLTERLRWMTEMCEELNISIILIHHTRKTSQNGRSVNVADELAGGSAISSAAQSIITLSRTRKGPLLLECTSKIAEDQKMYLTRSSSPLRFTAEDLNKAERDAEKAEYLKTGIHQIFQKNFETNSVFECRMTDLLHIAAENNIKLYTCAEKSPDNVKARSVALQLKRYTECIYNVDRITYTSRRFNNKVTYKFEKLREEAEDDETTQKIAS